MDFKVSKDKYISRLVGWENLIYVRCNSIKNCAKRWSIVEKESKTLHEVKPVEKIDKNLESFLKISPVQKELPPSHKLQGHAYE